MGRSVEEKRHIMLSYVTNEEHTKIKHLAKQAQLATSVYIRNACLGLRIESKVDQKAVLELIKINADMGRLGGLLKLWLTSETEHSKDVRPLLNELLELKDILAQKIKQI